MLSCRLRKRIKGLHLIADRARETLLEKQLPLARNAMRIIWCCIFIFCVPTHSSISSEISCVSMVQRQALAVVPGGRKPRPWEVNNYIIANYHKAGAFLSDSLTRTILEILGAPKEVFGHVEYPCYSSGSDSFLHLCHNMEAPFLVYTDAFNASVAGWWFGTFSIFP